MKGLSSMVWWCLIALFVSISAQAGEGLVLWNRLGSSEEVLNSDIGPSFEIREDGGDVLFLDDSVFGRSMATTGGTANLGPAGGYLAMNPDDFFPEDKTLGTVEFWVQKRVAKLIPYQTSLVTFFGRQRYATGYNSIAANWNDENPSVVHFAVYDGQWHVVRDNGWEAIPVGQWVHLAFVWNGSGIDGGPDDLRIYRDGILVGSHQGRFSEVVPFCCVGYSCGESYCSSGGYEVRVLANHEGRRMTGCPQYTSGYCPIAYMDNIIVWDYAKTDFSDRFVEDPTDYSTFAEFSIDRAALRFRIKDSDGSADATNEGVANAETEEFGVDCADSKGADTVLLRASFVLGETSEGIDPINDEMTVTVGSYTLTIPSGSFVMNGGYRYRGTIDGAKVFAQLRDDWPDAYDFYMKIQGIDLADTANPVSIRLEIGNDGGEVEERLQGVLTNNRLIKRSR